MKIIQNLDLTEYNSYRIHSVADTAYYPETLEEVIEIVNKENPIIIGGGCNVIFTQEKYSRPIMFIRDNFSGIKQCENHLIVKAGTDLKVLSEYALEHSLTGLEWYYDIPGCVGGATIMNAGCSGASFSDLIVRVTYYDIDRQKVATLTKEELHFEYRGNVFKTMNVVVLEVELELRHGEMSEIKALMESNKANRWAKQPREYPSAGSVFKRPIGHFVGPMITEVGLKGYRIGDAMISDKHAGFIVNVGQAKGSDIVALINYARSKVKEKFDVDLEVEQRLI